MNYNFKLGSGVKLGFKPPFFLSKLDLSSWYDASDTSTITVGATGASHWSDKSGKGYHLTQGTGGNQPLTGSRTINGLNALDFDGTDDVMSCLNASAVNWFVGTNKSISVFAVVRPDGALLNQFFCNFSNNSTSNRVEFGQQWLTEGQTRFFIQNSSGLNAINDRDFVPTTNPYLYMAGTNSGVSTHRINGDGSLIGQDSFPYGEITSLVSLNIGARKTVGFLAHFNGAIGEIIILRTMPSQEIIDYIEGYLAHKWGLTLYLPSSHPYKTTNPAIFTNHAVGRIGQREHWTPAKLSTIGWYDATDTSTISGSTGVSQWSDKSGNNYHLVQATVENRPTNGGQIQGNNGIVFTQSTQKFLHNNSIASNFNGPFSIYAVFTRQTSGTRPAVYISARDAITGNATSNTTRSYIVTPTTNINNIATQWGNDSSSTFEVGSATSIVLIGSERRSANLCRMYYNGVLQGTPSTETFNLNFTNFSVGGIYQVGAIAGFFSSSTMGEIVIVSGDVTDGIRQKIEGYLAHKWGIESNLPINHPYKLLSP